MGIGSKIKQVIKEKNMTIKQIAEKTGIPVNTLYSIIKRDSERVRPETVQALADVLGVTPTYLIGYDDGIVNPERYSREELDEIKAAAFECYRQSTDELDDVDIAFYDGYRELSEDDKETIRRMVEVMRERRKEKK